MVNIFTKYMYVTCTLYRTAWFVGNMRDFVRHIFVSILSLRYNNGRNNMKPWSMMVLAINNRSSVA